MKKEYQFLAVNIVNQLFDLAEVPVTKRQEINDKAYDFVQELIESRCPVIEPYAEIEKEEDFRNVIKWFGECVFPQKLSDVINRFDERSLLFCIKLHYITKSSAVKGLHPLQMESTKGYVELTSAGWALYEQIKIKAN